MLRNVKDDKTFLSAKFQFSVIQFVEVISNKPFFLAKALNPGLKLLEYCIHIVYCGESGRFLGGSHVQSRFCPVN